MSIFYQVWKALWPLKPQEKAAAIEQLKKWSNSETLPADTSRRTLSSEEIRSLAKSDMISIGAHTSDHSLLTAHDAVFQRQDIQRCQNKLNEILGEPVSSFAYPHGEFNDDTLRILHESGYTCALTVQASQVRSGADPMRLPRFGVKNQNGEQFKYQMQAWQNQ
jgi:peptidoglycan/xylan/chitin deacetylase (PgdA/CDA1 family)